MAADSTTKAPRDPGPAHSYSWLVWALAGIGAALLVIDHWAHIFGVLPYLILLACPLIHFFMHRGHGGGHDGDKK
jgi:hypothetical protein